MSTEIAKNFFEAIAEKLEETFPKGKCNERGEALVLVAYAHILHIEAMKKARCMYCGRVMKVV